MIVDARVVAKTRVIMIARCVLKVSMDGCGDTRFSTPRSLAASPKQKMGSRRRLPSDIDCQAAGGGGMRYVSLITGEERERPRRRRRPFKINKVHPKVYRMGRAESRDACDRVQMRANESPRANQIPVRWSVKKRFV